MSTQQLVIPGIPPEQCRPITDEKRPTLLRKQKFFAQMEATVPWGDIMALIEPFYPKVPQGAGRRPAPLLLMLKMYFIQIWYSLSDEGTEEMLYDSEAARAFARLSESDRVPDATSLLKFRRLVEKNGIGQKIFRLVTEKLEAAGLIMHGGTMVDATIVNAPKSTRNKEHSRDKEMDCTYKHGNHYFGAKAHIGVDTGTGYVHSLSVTPANVSDIAEMASLARDDDDEVGGDSGYVGMEKREEVKGDEILSAKKFVAVPRPSSIRIGDSYVKEIDKEARHGLISKRQKVEYPFHILKDIFKFRKTPFKGLKKLWNHLHVAFALVNLAMVAYAKRSLEPMGELCLECA
jgi:IS5 family transposase